MGFSYKRENLKREEREEREGREGREGGREEIEREKDGGKLERMGSLSVCLEN